MSTRKPPSELQTIARQYAGLSWQVKGIVSAIKGMSYRIPQQGLLIPKYGLPAHTRCKLIIALNQASEALEQAEYLLKKLSAEHREAYKNTRSITKDTSPREGVDT